MSAARANVASQVRFASRVLAACLALPGPQLALAQVTSSGEPHVIVTSPAQRQAYLANARVWEPRDLPSPEAIVEGPPRPGVASRASLNPPDGIPCTYESGGAQMGGRTPKFTCRTDDGRSLRVKYYSGDPATGNREVFAEVVTTRLFWALGFHADAVYPITVNCRDCPADPMKGTGARATRRFLGVTEPPFAGLLILSKADPEEGWKFGDFDAAIDTLPDGPERATRRAQFDALRSLAAFVQHGDRKHAQQRLVCLGEVQSSAGDVHPLGSGDDSAFTVPALFERPGASACETPVAMIQDLGATLGSSGLKTSQSDKVNLDAWARRRVVVANRGRAGTPAGCRLDVTASITAGSHAKASSPVSEAGRRFLVEQLDRLTDAHIRALFGAGRLDALGEPAAWTDPATKTVHRGADAWVALFKHKRAQVSALSCGEEVIAPGR
jgi:hypothetical protein